MKAKLTSRTETFILCPNCGKGEGRVDHLFSEAPRSFGPWYCDECGHSYTGAIDASGEVEIMPFHQLKFLTFDLLSIPPQTEPIYFIVEGMRFTKHGEERDQKDENQHATYLYEEHSCPTNFVPVEEIVFDGDTDPHGIFKFVRSVDRPATDDGDFNVIEALLGEACAK